MFRKGWYGLAILPMLLAAPSILAGPLHDAAREGDVAAARSLLEQGADPNLPDPFDLPLHFAALTGSVAVVELLIRAGADVNGESSLDGALPLHAAALERHRVRLKHIRRF